MNFIGVYLRQIDSASVLWHIIDSIFASPMKLSGIKFVQHTHLHSVDISIDVLYLFDMEMFCAVHLKFCPAGSIWIYTNICEINQ